MDLTAIIKAVLDPGTGQSGRVDLSLQPGELLTGRVIKLAGDGRVVMDFGRFRARAQIDVAVQPGQPIMLEVVESGTPLKLRIRDNLDQHAKSPMPQLDFRRVMTAADQERLLDLMDRLVKSTDAPMRASPLPRHILDALAQLKSVMQPLPISTGGNIDSIVQYLQQTIGSSGLFFEKELAEAETGNALSGSRYSDTSGQPVRSVIASDLKSQLLQLKSFFVGLEAHAEAPTDLSRKEVSFIKHSLEHLLTHLQNQQGRMTSRLGDHDPMLVITHQLYVEDQRLPVKLKVYYPKKGVKDRHSGINRLAMLLNMDRLGPVRVDIITHGDSLEVGFFVQNELVRQTLDSAIGQVKNVLNKIYGRVQIVTRISEQKISQFDREDRSGSGTRIIDIQI